MMSDDFFPEYLRHLVRLHELIMQGQGDSADADTVRDQMDWPWSQLNRRQIELADELSCDLYTLGTNRAVTGLEQTSVDEFGEAVRRQDWAGALKLIRQHESSLTPAASAFLRGACWAHLEQPAIALKFIEESSRIEPLDSEKVVWYLSCLIQAGRAIDAVPNARELLRTSSDLMLRRTALEVLFAAASQLPETERRAMLPDTCQIAESFLADEGQRSSCNRTEAQLSLWLHLAISYLDLDDDQQSKSACLRALNLQPDNRLALELLGFLNYEAFPQAERRPFVQRLQRESTPVIGHAPLTIA